MVKEIFNYFARIGDAIAPAMLLAAIIVTITSIPPYVGLWIGLIAAIIVGVLYRMHETGPRPK